MAAFGLSATRATAGRPGLSREEIGAEGPVADTVDGDKARLLTGNVQLSLDRARLDHAVVGDEGEEVAVVENRLGSERVGQEVVEGDVDHDGAKCLALRVPDGDRTAPVVRSRWFAGQELIARRVERTVLDLLRHADEGRATPLGERFLHWRGMRERARGLNRLAELFLVVGRCDTDRRREPGVRGACLPPLRDLAEGHRRRDQRQQREQHEVDDEPELEASHRSPRLRNSRTVSR